jgi:hypothetical protein
MGNAFGTVEDVGSERLYLSNGGTDVFFDVMTLLFADGHRADRGFSGFDLTELPWTTQAAGELAFVDAVVAKAQDRHGWQLLNYDPPFIADHLRGYRLLVHGFTPTPNPTSPYGDWTRGPASAELDRCPQHAVYVGSLGCRLCDTWILPLL